MIIYGICFEGSYWVTRFPMPATRSPNAFLSAMPDTHSSLCKYCIIHHHTAFEAQPLTAKSLEVLKRHGFTRRFRLLHPGRCKGQHQFNITMLSHTKVKAKQV